MVHVQQLGEAQDGVERGAQLMAQARQEAALCRGSALGRVTLDGDLRLHLLDGDVAHDAQDVCALSLVAVHAAGHFDAAHIAIR